MKKLQLALLSILLGTSTARMQAQTMESEASTGDLVKVYIKQDPATYEKKSTQNTEIDFAVQVSASSRPVTESNAKREWNELGHVYVQQENGLYKVRIGPYSTQVEAKETLLKAKSKGRNDAFIVVLQGTANDKPLYQSGTLTQSKSPSSELKSAEYSQDIEESDHSQVSKEYKVQVASYSKPGAFNTNGIEKLGTLESYRKGDVTLMMISGFKNLPEAQRAQKAVISKGFTEASIVVDNNGILETVK